MFWSLKNQEHPFVRNSVCSQFSEGLFAILAECSQFCLRAFFQIQGEIHHFAGWEGGWLRGTKIVNKTFVNKRAFPKGTKDLRGAPSTVRNFMTSSGCSMEGALPKKETVPTVLGVAQF